MKSNVTLLVANAALLAAWLGKVFPCSWPDGY
jgi:hypothetical protein